MPKIIISIIVVGFQRMPTTENYEKMLGTWVGAPEERLISAWGPPNQTYESGNSKYLTFIRGGATYTQLLLLVKARAHHQREK